MPSQPPLPPPSAQGKLPGLLEPGAMCPDPVPQNRANAATPSDQEEVGIASVFAEEQGQRWKQGLGFFPHMSRGIHHRTGLLRSLKWPRWGEFRVPARLVPPV